MKWNDEIWKDNDGYELVLVRAGEGGGVIVNGNRREVSEGDLYAPSGSDSVGVYTVNEDDLRGAGFNPPDDTGGASPTAASSDVKGNPDDDDTEPDAYDDPDTGNDHHAFP